MHGLIAWRNMRTWRRWSFRGGAVAASLVVAASILLLCFRPSVLTLTNVGPALGIGLAWLIIMWASPRFSAQRQFRGTPSAQNRISIEVSDSGVNIQSVHTESQAAWSAYVGWAEDKSIFVILPQPRIYIPVPKRAFTSGQLDEFREILRRNVGSTKSR